MSDLNNNKGNNMNQFDVSAYVNSIVSGEPQFDETFLREFGGAVATEVKKCTIRHNLETKPHTFRDGSVADISKKLTIEIEFNDAIIQPHSTFEDDFCTKIIDAISDNVNGLFENSDQ